MYSFSLLAFVCFLSCFDLSRSAVYETRCNSSSECAVYPDISQGPDLIWIPFFCNEKNLCACPNGWIPNVVHKICISKVSGPSTEGTCAGYIWGISTLLVTLLALMTCRFISLYLHRRPPSLPIVRNQ